MFSIPKQPIFVSGSMLQQLLSHSIASYSSLKTLAQTCTTWKELTKTQLPHHQVERKLPRVSCRSHYAIHLHKQQCQCGPSSSQSAVFETLLGRSKHRKPSILSLSPILQQVSTMILTNVNLPFLHFVPSSTTQLYQIQI